MGMALVLTTACDPMEDIYDELDAEGTAPITGEIEFTLTDDDYTDKDGLNLNYSNFSTIDDAKTMIPGFLVDKYPVWGEGSLATVTFKWFSKVNTYSKNVYALSDAEHNAITGKTYGNFDKSYHVYKYLEVTYPSPSDGDFVSLRYRYYSGGETTITDGFVFKGSGWSKIKGFTIEEYKSMEESYPNFSNHDEAGIKIPVALVDRFKYSTVETGEIVPVMYELYKGGGVTKSYVNNYVYDGSAWSKYNNVSESTIKFGHDGTVWVPDNTIKYSLTSADFTLIGDALLSTYPGPAGSASNYGNFDRRVGNANYWSNEMIVEGLDIFLNDFHSNAEEGQKYTISYAIYNGSSGVETMNVIKTGGVWLIN